MYYESIIEESQETRAYRLPLTFLHYAAIFFRFLHFSLPPFTLDMFKRTYYYSDSFSVPRVLQFLCCIQQLNMYWPLRWQHLQHYVINLQCFTKLYANCLFQFVSLVTLGMIFRYIMHLRVSDEINVVHDQSPDCIKQSNRHL